jgi:hypothetical protein
MNGPIDRQVLVTTLALILVAAAWPAPDRTAADAGELDLQPIEIKPERPTELHPKLRWMTEQKIRGIWIGGDLFDKYEGGDKTKGDVLADAGFNLVRVKMGINTDGKRSDVIDPAIPLDAKHDRTLSTRLETQLAPNIAEARRVGLVLMIGWNYGTHHLEPYRKYRSATDGLAKFTCCPIEETYITGQHIGKWAVKLARGGADGMVIDMEMYHSDKGGYHGSCVCDDCFSTYLKRYAKNWQAVFDNVPADGRGKWLGTQKADEHYSAFANKRIEAMYDSIRRRCQDLNPTFFFGIAPMMYHLPGVERGLGTPTVPCLVFSEHEYHNGPYRGSFIGTRDSRIYLPTRFLPGAYVAVQSPEKMAANLLQASLYCDGWWAWYGEALLTDTGAGEAPGVPYGRVEGTSARDYLDLITTTHARLDQLLASPKEQWPKRQDGKLNSLQAKLADAKAAADTAKSPEADKALAEATAALEKYVKLVRMGGY